MTKTRDLANLVSGSNPLVDGVIDYSEITNTPAPFDPDTLAAVAVSGSYADLGGKPALATVATSGSFTDLSNQPAPFDPATLASVATTGAYGSLSGTPAAALPLAGGTLTGNVNLGDNVKANFGASNDLQIYHDGSNSYVADEGTGNLYLRSNGNGVVIQGKTGENSITAVADGAVFLYHDNAQKFTTTATGINVTGNATFPDGGKAIFGAGSDLEIYTDGNHSYINEQGTGNLRIRASNFEVTNSGATHNMIVATDGGSVSLRYEGSTKLDTSATGITVTGTVSASSGSSSLPSLSFLGDPNTGIYNSGADNLGFAIGGVARAFMSATQFNMTGAVVATSFTGNGSALTGIPGPSTAFGAVGTYALLSNNNYGNYPSTYGTLIPGSQLSWRYDGGSYGTIPDPPGTWRAMGMGNPNEAQVFVRVS